MFFFGTKILNNDWVSFSMEICIYLKIIVDCYMHKNVREVRIFLNVWVKKLAKRWESMNNGNFWYSWTNCYLDFWKIHLIRSFMQKCENLVINYLWLKNFANISYCIIFTVKSESWLKNSSNSSVSRRWVRILLKFLEKRVIFSRILILKSLQDTFFTKNLRKFSWQNNILLRMNIFLKVSSDYKFLLQNLWKHATLDTLIQNFFTLSKVTFLSIL